MKKTLFLLLLLLAGLRATATSFLYTHEGQTLSYSYIKSGDEIVGLSVGQKEPVVGRLVIPETASDGTNSYPVTEIKHKGFAYAAELTSLVLPSSLTNIADSAFCLCEKLGGKVNIPPSVTSIGNFAFFCNSKLRVLNLSEGLKSIGNMAFWCCYWLTDLTIPASVETIGHDAFSTCVYLKTVNILGATTTLEEYAFEGCERLTSINIPSEATSISKATFANCTALPSITIPSTVKTIGQAAFSGCAALTSITIPNSVTELGPSAFSGCAFTELSIPASIPLIGKSAFSQCPNLTTVSIPTTSSVDESAFERSYQLSSIEFYNPNPDTDQPAPPTSIGKKAFAYTNITTINLPEGVTAIGEYAFAYCRNLTTAHFPASTTELGYDVFADSYNPFLNTGHVTSLYCAAITPPVADIYNSNLELAFNPYVVKTCTVYVPTQSVDAYRNSKIWREFANIQGYDFTEQGSSQINSINANEVSNETYDLQGRRVNNPTKGIFIVNGQKMRLN